MLAFILRRSTKIELKILDPWNAPWQIWLKTECLCEAHVQIPGHTYRNVTIQLPRAAPLFHQHVVQNNTDFSTPYTTDGGFTWHIDRSELKTRRLQLEQILKDLNSSNRGKLV